MMINHQRIQKGDKASRVPLVSDLGESDACLRGKAAIDPDVASAPVVGGQMRALALRAKTAGRITLGAHRLHLIDTDHMRVGRGLLIECDDGPLFSANCGSGRSLK